LGYIHGKEVKIKEKNKKMALGVAVFLLIRWELFSCSTEMQQALIFWPLRLLVLRVVAMHCPMCLCAIEDGRHGCPDLRRERVMWYSGRTPIVVEVWMSLWWNDRGHVESGRGSHAPVDCAQSRPSHQWERVPRLGCSRGSPSCQRVPQVPQTRWK
jgi:hypothetical protein